MCPLKESVVREIRSGPSCICHAIWCMFGGTAHQMGVSWVGVLVHVGSVYLSVEEIKLLIHGLFWFSVTRPFVIGLCHSFFYQIKSLCCCVSVVVFLTCSVWMWLEIWRCWNQTFSLSLKVFVSYFESGFNDSMMSLGVRFFLLSHWAAFTTM